MKVADVMTSTLKTIDRQERVDVALQMMEKHNIRHLIVTHQGKPESILSDRDLLTVLSVTSEFRPQENPIKVGQVSSKNPVSVTPETSLVSAAEKMMEKKISALPVFNDKEELCGILTTHDLLRCLIQKLSSEK
jgi:acetoin utilization protein AcuB